MQEAGNLSKETVHDLPLALLPLLGLRHDFPCQRQEPFLHQNAHKHDREGFIIRGAIEHQQSTALVPIRQRDRKSTRLNSSHQIISYAVFCLKKKKQTETY